MTRLAITLIALTPLTLGAVACSKGKGSSAAAGTGLAIDAAAVNSLVPAPLKDKLVFEKQDVVLERSGKTTYSLAYPKGWKQGMKMFGNLEAPTDSGLGFSTKMSVGPNCDGECKPKDWEKISNTVNFEPLAQSGKVLKDVKGKGTRLMVAEHSTGGSDIEIIYAWWTEGASSYRTCQATIDADIKDAAPAFEKACQAITVSGDD